jgi:hypothetical protein
MGRKIVSVQHCVTDQCSDSTVISRSVLPVGHFPTDLFLKIA